MSARPIAFRLSPGDRAMALVRRHRDFTATTQSPPGCRSAEIYVVGSGEMSKKLASTGLASTSSTTRARST
jgi:hypothetical protein